MLIPDYWAEASLKHKVGGKQITVRRFGWSEQSQEDAQRNADARAEDAFARIVAGEKLERRELKMAYNGAVGVPIRGEVLSRHEGAVITRNLYGARCLNTPNVLFADIDFVVEPMSTAFMWAVLFLMLVSFSSGKIFGGWWLGLGSAFAAWYVGYRVAKWLWAQKLKAKGSPEEQAMIRVDAFMEKHPNWHLRIYRTPAGLRLLAMHKTFGPEDSEVATIFKEIEADRIYVQMCTNQHCFRARVSPKPWRIGIESHLKPRPGVWPINSERMPDRVRWVEEYERKSEAYASCRFITSKGNGVVDPVVEKVRVLHDELCRAHSDLPIA